MTRAMRRLLKQEYKRGLREGRDDYVRLLEPSREMRLALRKSHRRAQEVEDIVARYLERVA